MKPPRFAETLIGLLAPAEVRAPLLGDLYEELARDAQLSPAVASRNYWRQALVAMPALLLMRWRKTTQNAGSRLVAITLCAYLFTVWWELAVARTAASAMAHAFDDAPDVMVRTIFLVLQAASFAAAAALVAGTGPRPIQSPPADIAKRLTPLAAALLAPPIMVSILSHGLYPLSYRAPWCALMTLALFLGAIAGWKTRNSQRARH